MKNNLAGLSVLVTRPKPQGEILCEHIRAAGGEPVYLPAIDIVPPKNITACKEQLAQANQYAWLIFVSPQSVYHSIPFLPASVTAKIAAMGAGTAQALTVATLPVTVYPQTVWSSEGLLALPEFQQVAGQQIAVICGEGGRETLTETLTARGALVMQIAVYQRKLPEYSNIDRYIGLLHAKKIDVIVCASAETLHNLITLIGKTNQALLQSVLLVVVSERLVAVAEELHFKKVFLADNASHEAIIAALETICRIQVIHHERN